MIVRTARQLLWRALAVLALLLALVGVAVPVLPTVPFLLVAAWAAGRGWPALEARMLAHPVFGEHIRQWRERGAVPRKAKWIATIMMAASSAVVMTALTQPWLRFGVPTMLLLVAIWLWCRPETGTVPGPR